MDASLAPRTGAAPHLAARRIGDEPWRGAADALARLAEGLAAGAGTVVKANRRRTVTRVALPAGGVAYVKRFLDAGVAQTAKALLLGSRARREYFWARRLAAAGLPVATPLGFAEQRAGGVPRGCAVATLGVEGGLPLIEVLATPGLAPQRRRTLLAGVADLLRRVHGAGIAFRDFHLGNVLATPDDGLVLIDLTSAWRPGPLLPRYRVENLAMALTSCPRSAWGDARRALGRYGAAADLRPLARRVASRAATLVARHLRSRSARCLRDSSAFAVETTAAGRLFRARALPADALLAAIADADARLRAGGPGIRKDARESAVVTGLGVAGTAVAVKHYRAHRRTSGIRQRLGLGRGRRAWMAGHTCVTLGVDVARPLALLEAAGGDAWLVMADLHDCTPLDRWIATRGREGRGTRRRGMARAVGAALGAMHAAGVLHLDDKACNVLVHEGDPPRVAFVDYDRIAVAWDREPATGDVLEALAQLACSIPRAVSRADRLRALRAYAAARARRGPSPVPARLFRDTWAVARDRAILWVGPEGDVHERWPAATGGPR